MNWIADTLFVFYGERGCAVHRPRNDRSDARRLDLDRRVSTCSARPTTGVHQGLSIAKHREHCSIWTGDGDIDEDGTYEPATDLCDDFKPLGNPGVAGRLTNASLRCHSHGRHGRGGRARHRTASTLWAATSTGRDLRLEERRRTQMLQRSSSTGIDDESSATPPRYPTAIFVDPADANHAWITYSGFNAKPSPIATDPNKPGHVFEVRYVPGASTFTSLDGTGDEAFLDIPATSIAVSDGTIVVGTDYGAVKSEGDGSWAEAGKGLPHVVVADLVLVPGKKDQIYAGTHGQGVWTLKFK